MGRRVYSAVDKRTCEEGENAYSDLSFDAHMGAVEHTRACMCMRLPSHICITYTPEGKNEQDSKQEDFIFSFSSLL